MPPASIRHWRSGRLGTREGHVVVGHAATITTPPPASPVVGMCHTGYAAAVRSRSLGATLCRRRARHRAVAAACSDDDDPAASATLPPIQTTTTTSTIAAPTTTQPRFYEVQRGDTLTKIAAAFGLPIPAIMEINGIVDPNADPGRPDPRAAAGVGDRGRRRCRRPTVPGPTALPAVTTVAP